MIHALFSHSQKGFPCQIGLENSYFPFESQMPQFFFHIYLTLLDPFEVTPLINHPGNIYTRWTCCILAMVKIRLSELKYTNQPSSLDTGHKTMKSSTFRNSAFWRCAGTCQNNQCTTAPSAKPGQLFGVSLMDVYDNDNLPFPILVGLSLVFYCLPEEKKLGEAKCFHTNLPPNMEIIRQPLAVAEKPW